MERTSEEMQPLSAARALSFVGLWVAAGLLTGLVARSLSFEEHPRLFFLLLLIVGWGLAPLPLQALALRLFVSWSKRWVMASIMAVLPGAWLGSGGSALIGCPLAGAQWFILRSRVRYAVLWPVAVCATSFMRLVVLVDVMHNEPPSLVPFALLSAIEAGLMLHLLRLRLVTRPTAALAARSAAPHRQGVSDTPPAYAGMDTIASPTPSLKMPQASRSTADARVQVGTTIRRGVEASLRGSPRRMRPAPLAAQPVSARVSLFFFLAMVVVLSALYLWSNGLVDKPNADIVGIAITLGLSAIAIIVSGFLSLIAGAMSLGKSRRALLWMIPTTLLFFMAPLFVKLLLGI